MNFPPEIVFFVRKSWPQGIRMVIHFLDFLQEMECIARKSWPQGISWCIIFLIFVLEIVFFAGKSWPPGTLHRIQRIHRDPPETKSGRIDPGFPRAGEQDDGSLPQTPSNCSNGQPSQSGAKYCLESRNGFPVTKTTLCKILERSHGHSWRPYLPFPRPF